MLLEAAGVQVVGFEARDRVGGRMHSVRVEGGFYEAGAEWIDAADQRVLSLLAELGMEPEPGPHGVDWAILGGVRMTRQEAVEAFRSEWEALELASDELTLDLDLPPSANVLYGALDGDSLASLVARACSLPGRTWVEAHLRSQVGEELSGVGLLGWLCRRMAGELQGSAYRFPAGSSVVCEAMASRVAGPLHLNSPVANLEKLTEEFDRVVLALPPPMLLRLAPLWSEEKSDALEAFQMSRVKKIALEFRRPFWRESGWSGCWVSDGPIRQLWDGSRGERHFLMAYLPGNSAARSVEEVLTEIQKHCPFVTTEFLGATEYRWCDDSWAGGGFSVHPPEYMLSHWDALIRAEGALYFAGEHTALLNGFVEGALESAERVAQEVLTS